MDHYIPGAVEAAPCPIAGGSGEVTSFTPLL